MEVLAVSEHTRQSFYLMDSLLHPLITAVPRFTKNVLPWCTFVIPMYFSLFRAVTWLYNRKTKTSSTKFKLQNILQKSHPTLKIPHQGIFT